MRLVIIESPYAGDIERNVAWPDEEAGETAVIKMSKQRAGRLLDGVEHNQFPGVRT